MRYLLAALLLLAFGVPAGAQTSNMYWLGGTGNTGQPIWIPVTSATPLPVAGTFTATTAATASATPTAVSAGPGASLNVNLFSALFEQLTFAGTPVDGTHGLPVNCIVGCAGGTSSNATSGVATSSTNGQTLAFGYAFNGTTWDQLQDDASKNLKVNIAAGNITGFATAANQEVTAAGTSATSAQGVQGVTGGIPMPVAQATAANLNATVVGTGTFAVQASLNATPSLANGNGVVPTQGGSVLSATNGGYQNLLQGNAVLSATNGTYANLLQGNAVLSVSNGLPVQQVSPYPLSATAITATATGTTAATTATLAATSGKTTYICTMSIRANATAAATGNATVTGTITGTLNYTQWTAPLASGLGVTEELFTPCVPASGTNTSIAVVSAAPGSGGTVSVSASGYQQ